MSESQTTTFVFQPTSDDNWVFFPQPNFSTCLDDDDCERDVDLDVDADADADAAREREETESWVAALWCRIFKAKSASSSRSGSVSSSVNGDYEKVGR
jgi:hypothetical protein